MAFEVATALEQAEVLRALRKLYDASAPGGDPADLQRARTRALRVLEDLEPGAPVERRAPAATPAGQVA